MSRTTVRVALAIVLLASPWSLSGQAPRRSSPAPLLAADRAVDKPLGLTGGSGPEYNHAKIGVSTSGSRPYSIFGDMNQQGSLSGPNCGSSQDGRGGLFYVVDNAALHTAIGGLIKGESAPEK